MSRRVSQAAVCAVTSTEIIMNPSPAALQTTPAGPVELPYADALQMAIALHRDMRLDGAEKLYRRLLDIQPDDANAQHFLGMLLYRRGRREDRAEAFELFCSSIAIDPGVAAWHNNLGNALLDGGQVGAAAAAYARCSELDPDNVEVLNNLGCLLRGLGRTGEAETALRRALDARPDSPTRTPTTPRCWRFPAACPRPLRIASGRSSCSRSTRARKLLGVVYAQSGRLDEAARMFREWLAEEPGNVQARHHLAAVTGQGLPERAPGGHVVDVFDKFAGKLRRPAGGARIPGAASGRRGPRRAARRRSALARRARRRLRHGSLRAVAGTVRQAAGGSRPVDRHARQGPPARSRTAATATGAATCCARSPPPASTPSTL